MRISKYLGLQFCFGLVTLYGLISYTNGSRFRGDDYSNDEKLIYNYYRYGNELTWNWGEKSFCRVMRPPKNSINQRHSKVKTAEILLEALDCAKLEVEILVCVWASRHSGLLALFTPKDRYYVNGLRGEIYELRAARGICENQQTFVVNKRLDYGQEVEGDGPPKLGGVAQIFHARNAVRAKYRRRMRNRLSRDIAGSENGSSSSSSSSDDDDDQDIDHNNMLMDSAVQVMESIGSLFRTVVDVMDRTRQATNPRAFN